MWYEKNGVYLVGAPYGTFTCAKCGWTFRLYWSLQRGNTRLCFNCEAEAHYRIMKEHLKRR